MRIAVVGGGLQGVETVYLAQKAGWQVTLLDRKPVPPAMGLCNRFVQVDVTQAASLDDIVRQFDLIVPAMENWAALQKLVKVCRSEAVPLAFDPAAYAITHSKSTSNRLFRQLELPIPPAASGDQGPVIVKPSRSSGSKGVEKFESYREALTFLSTVPRGQNWICQKYLQGSMHSIEILGRPGRYQTFAVTDLFMDSQYDCMRVQAPTALSSDHRTALSDMALILAEALSLNGLMDLEVILCNDHLYLLEIDARIPSQTPTAVYWSTGANMVEQLGNLYLSGEMDAASPVENASAVIYEHLFLQTDGQTVVPCGEHGMTQAGPLTIKSGWFGCDEAITDADHDAGGWSATLVTRAENFEGCRLKRRAIFEGLGTCRN